MNETRGVLLTVLIVFVFLSLAYAAYPEISIASSPDMSAATVVLPGENKKTVESAQETAFRHKELGDGLRTQGNVVGAAEEYNKALSLYDGFPVEDRLMMARFLSWGGKLDEAIVELKKILSQEPENQSARTHLARCMSWKEGQATSTALAAGSTKTAGNAREMALKHKELGDGFNERDEVASAAEEYSMALSLYDGFLLEDRFLMTLSLSWGGKLDEAIRELNKILSEEPGHLKARIHLARCMSWKGDQAASLTESSKALDASPGNRDALLIRADALSRSGEYKDGISIYKEILEKGEDFDARLGLSQVYLSDGSLNEAREAAALLKPKYSYQEKELADLLADIDKAVSSYVSAGGGSPDTDASASAAKTGEVAPVSALRHKELGDELQERDAKLAAEEYNKALSMDHSFSIEERFIMARSLSWGGMLDEAIREFRKILSEEPENLKARIHLARCLSWKGDQAASLEESSKALEISPGNKEALLVRANALRWSGKQKAGVSVYKDILEQGEDFDTRLGLSQVYLSDGYLRGALKTAAPLKPEYPYQEKEFANFRADVDKATRPDAGASYSYYSDSDNNRAHRYNVYGGFWTGYWKWRVNYFYTDASSPDLNAQSHRVTLSTDSRPLEWLWIGGTAGYSRSEGENSSGDAFVGNLRAGTRVYDGRLDVSVSRNALADIAGLINRKIRNTEIATNISYPLPYRFSAYAGYAYRDYSDGNSAMDMYGMIRHRIGIISTGYRFRYLDFQKQSGGGYFDPSNYMSHRLDIAMEYEKEKWYTYLSLYGGHQAYNRYDASQNSFFGGWIAVLGRHLTGAVYMEVHGEGSNEAGGTTAGSGFRYNEFGARLRVRF